jgi:hypothetical protein
MKAFGTPMFAFEKFMFLDFDRDASDKHGMATLRIVDGEDRDGCNYIYLYMENMDTEKVREACEAFNGAMIAAHTRPAPVIQQAAE